MTREDYKAIRKALGTQEEVAKRLYVTRETVVRRERGQLEITREAELALLALRKKLDG
jgi:DNA-binding XRE family transcriptional regulator